MAITLTGVVCAALGWALGSWQSTDDEAKTARAPQPASRPAAPAPGRIETASLVSVASDGRVTMRIEQQPLSWVLEELQRQSGGLPLCVDGIEPGGRTSPAKRAAPAPGTPASGTPAPRITATPASPTPAVPPVATRNADPIGTILRGSEPERYEGLIQALGDGGGVPESVLKTLFETDGSPRVRQLAFEASLEAYVGDPAALRGALEAAQRLPDATLVEDATRRLDELNGMPSPDTVPQVAPER
jgi:hypothetical protein